MVSRSRAQSTAGQPPSRHWSHRPSVWCRLMIRFASVLGQVLEVAQHQHRPLPAGQPAQRLPQPVPFVDSGVRIVAGRRLGQLRRRPLAEPAPLPPRGVRVDQDPADVRFRVAVDPSPRLPGPGQRGLQQVLGGAPVVGQQVRGPQQPRGPGDDELVETFGCLSRQRPSLRSVPGYTGWTGRWVARVDRRFPRPLPRCRFRAARFGPSTADIIHSCPCPQPSS